MHKLLSSCAQANGLAVARLLYTQLFHKQFPSSFLGFWCQASLQTTKIGAAPIICFRVGGSFSQNPETTFLLGPGGMHVEHHVASAPRCRGAGDQRCVEMTT